MKSRLYYIALLIFLCLPGILRAEETTMSFEDLQKATNTYTLGVLNDISSLKNPFHSPLPATETMSSLTNETNSNHNPAPTETKPPNLKISGLVWNTNLPQAIVNDRVVSVGDTIDEWQVTAINQSGIEVVSKGVKFTVKSNFDI